MLECPTEQLHRQVEVHRMVERSGTLIARGNGRSYGDAALNTDFTLSMTAMRRMQAFDASTGLLTCEAGALLADVLETFVPRGWFVPVVPGTAFVSIGGMVAADVHGKNHHRDGSFGSYVESLVLATAGGEMLRCSRRENTDLFLASIGGMGLTGVILSVSFRLIPVKTAFVQEETLVTRDLDETMTFFEESQRWPYSVAWVDCTARGGRLGRALVSRSEWADRDLLPRRFAQQPLCLPSKVSLRVPVDAPSTMLNPLTIRLFNGLNYCRGRIRAGLRYVPYGPFFFPLDRINAWNRLYGRRGFVQYQCVLPRANSSSGIARLLEQVARRQPSLLAVLKLFGPAGEGLMSFPLEGYTLALDFPMRSDTLRFVKTLDGITHAHGGRVYLAKDACAAPADISEGYPGAATFRAIRAESVGMREKFASALSQRLAL
ncbi:MAG: FAD-binding oxidoreductase [Candidatus Tectomicrobia bacterium]|nr:FAD-binding oxidoreductase [Candidatus Tectomicrobia bacterium]